MNRGDLLVVALAAAAIGALYARFWQPPVAAAYVEVRTEGKVVGRYALDSARELDVDGRLGVSQLRIADGRVRFLHSPCRNKVCVHSGWLAHSGDAAACLPNRVSLSLGGGTDSLDAISF